jgi:hypothetical protein
MIRDSIDNGLEGTVFPKYAEYMLAHRLAYNLSELFNRAAFR